MRDKTTANVLCFLAGLGIGGVIGMLAAPRSGTATRQILTVKATEAQGFLAGSSRDYFDRGRELYDRGRQLAEEAAMLFDEGRRLMEQADANGNSA
ncbi:MAG: YtxH domain-containing protein [Bryobacteraceae bacterium]|nr:YtxH domain-containing protein [Bryobacteraceae bacterium]